MIHRGDLSRDFGRIPNATLRAVQLPALAYKILHYSLSHAESYLVNAEHLERVFPEGRRAIAAACQALEAAGHLERPRARRERGRWTPAPWVFYATPASSTAGSADGSEASTPTALPVSAMRSTAPPPAATREPAGQVLEDQSKKISKEDQITTDDDDRAHARGADQNVNNPNPRAEPTPPDSGAVADVGSPDPHLSMPAAGTSPAGSTAGTETNEGSPIPSLACSPWMLTAESLVDREVIGFGVELGGAARHQLVAAVAERLAAGVEPGALAEELGGELPPGADAVTVLLGCVRQTRPADGVHQADAVDGVASNDGTPGAQMTYDGRTSSPAHGDQSAAGVDLVQALIDTVHEVTGQTIDRNLAGKGVAMVLRTKDGIPRAVSDPVAYLRTAVEAAPTRFLPSMVPPRAGGRRESRAARRARGFDELRAWAAEATDSGKRLDNTGAVVIDQDGQAASTTPAEPLSDPWATGITPGGWLAAPARQCEPEPHLCRYGCRPGQHTYEDPETRVPTRCPIHHEHARHREAA